MEILTESHIILDERVDNLIDVLLNELKYELMTKSVQGKAYLDDHSNPHSWIEMAGKEFNEFLKSIEKKEKILRLPDSVSLKLSDDVNPCKDLFSSDCEYRFNFNILKERNFSNLSSAFVTKEGNYGCVHCVVFDFYIDLYDIENSKPNMRHEIKHVYSELISHIAKEKETNIRKSDNDKISLGSLKSAMENEKMSLYNRVVIVMNGSATERPMNIEEDKLFKSLNIMAKSLYYLSKTETMANYSKYYETIRGKNSFDRINWVYKEYLDLYDQVSDGVYLSRNYDNVDSLYQAFDNEKAYEMMKPLVKLSFKYIPETSKEFQEKVMLSLGTVMNRFDGIFDEYKEDFLPAEERFHKEYNKYFGNMLDEYKDRFGEIRGLYEFTILKNYKESHIPFMDTIRKIKDIFG